MASPPSVGVPTREPSGAVTVAARTGADRAAARPEISGGVRPREGRMPFFLLRSGVIDLVSPTVAFRARSPRTDVRVSAPMPVPFIWWGFRKGRVL